MRRRIIGAAALAIAGASAGAAMAADAAPPWSLQAAVGAPAALKLSGSVRLRYEVVDGQARAALPAREDIVNLRTTLSAEYGAGPLRIGAEIYDSRVYDARAGGAASTNEVNAAELVQAYVARDFKLGGGKASVEAGRFMMNLGSRRLIAADDYRNTTSGYTGVRVEFGGADGTDVVLFATAPQVRLPDGQAALLKNRVRFDRESTDFLVWGMVASHPVHGVLVEATYVGLSEKDAPGRPTRDRRLATFGGRVMRAPHPHRFDVEVEAFRQSGEISAGLQAGAPRLDVAAGFLHADAGYQFADRWRTRLSIEYDLASGDGPGRRFGRFDTLLGMRRGDYAPSGLYATTARANISSPGVRIEVSPGARWDAFLSARPMWLASRTDSFATTGVRDPSGGSGRYAGAQVEGRGRYWLAPGAVRLEVDGVWLSKGRFLTRAPNAPADGDTTYLSLNAIWSF